MQQPNPKNLKSQILRIKSLNPSTSKKSRRMSLNSFKCPVLSFPIILSDVNPDHNLQKPEKIRLSDRSLRVNLPKIS